MHTFFKLVWLISIYGVIFFTFTSITFSTAAQFYKFKVTDEIINSNIIMVILYLVILFVTSVGLCKERERRRQNESNIEMKHLYSEDKEGEIEIE